MFVNMGKTDEYLYESNLRPTINVQGDNTIAICCYFYFLLLKANHIFILRII